MDDRKMRHRLKQSKRGKTQDNHAARHRGSSSGDNKLYIKLALAIAVQFAIILSLVHFKTNPSVNSVKIHLETFNHLSERQNRGIRVLASIEDSKGVKNSFEITEQGYGDNNRSPNYDTEKETHQGTRMEVVKKNGNNAKNKIEALWKGNSLEDSTKNFNRIIFVISGCDEQLHWLKDFTKGFPIYQIFLFAKCDVYLEDLEPTISPLFPSTEITYKPFPGGSTLAFSRWISSSLSTLNDDDVVLFLKGDSQLPCFDRTRTMEQRHSRRRSLSEILQATSTYDFGCLAEITGWSDADMSVYHDTESVMKFQSSDTKFVKNMEDWLQLVNVTLPQPLASVCYGGEFAVAGKQLKMRGAIFWNKWEEKVEKTTKATSHQYAERSWAGMLSSPLSESNMVELLRYKTGMSLEKPFVGALLHHEILREVNRPKPLFKNEFPDHSMDELIDAIWTGDILDGNSSRFDRVFVVISHCKNPLEWYNDFVKDVEIYQTIIYSKCSAALPDIKSASFETLEDIGSSDHTFAHFMANLPKDITDDDAIVFLHDDIITDDSDSTFKPRSLHNMLRIASGKGFGCRMQFQDEFSAYHSEIYLSAVRPDQKETSSKVKDFGEWLHSVNGCLPSPLTEVCYGGGFAVDAARIKRRKPEFWKGIEKSLSRGRDTEESYYAERSWAGLLGKPLSDESLMHMKNIKKLEVKDFDHNIRGTLTREGPIGFLKNVEAMWTGGAVGGNRNSFNRLFIVLSSCRNKLLWFPRFVNEFSVHHLTAYYRTRCKTKMNDKPKAIIESYNSTIVKQRKTLSDNHAYAHWMAEMAPELNDDDFVVFLVDEPIPEQFHTRSLREMLRIASVTGFGCMVEFGDEYSAYRDVGPLSTYRPSTDVKIAQFENMEGWLRSVNITLPKPYTNVCYGGNFAVRASQIKKHPYDLWKGVELSLNHKDFRDPHEDQYAMRSWAGLLTEPLSERYINSFKDISLGKYVNYYSEMLIGALVSMESEPFYSEVDMLWRGDVHGGDLKIFRRIYIVVSHCTNKLDWLKQYIQGFDIHSITIYSKCIAAPVDAPEGATLRRLPNVGRCDHTYAHWIAKMYSSLNDDDVVVFLKDSRHIHQKAKDRSLYDMLRIASVTGFGCRLELTNGFSAYHSVSDMLEYKKTSYQRLERDQSHEFYSSFKNMGRWLDSVGGILPEPYTQVCYGGVFVAKASQIKSKPLKLWSAMAKSLSRGDNIEEGHYAERSWAGLLAVPVSRDGVRSLRHYAEFGGISRSKYLRLFDFRGSISLDRPSLENFARDSYWKHDTTKGDLSVFRRIFLVVSHCSHSLSWLPDFTKKFIIHNITIYSKCGQTPDFVPQEATIISLPNVGGYHHTYSYWMTNMKPEDIEDTDAIFFLTDDREIKDWGRPRSMYQMLNVASHVRFACWLTPIKSRDYTQSDVSAYHNSRYLFPFRANGASMPLRMWVKRLGIKVQTRTLTIINVCYGSNFVVKGSQIKEVNKSTFENIEKNLARAGNAPEEEYAERIWAEMFSLGLGDSAKDNINGHQKGQLTHNKYQGAIVREDK